MNLFELFVKIGVDDQASGKLKDIGGKLGNGLATAAKIGTAAVGAAAAGITALTKAAVDNYAEYEQLIGGVETLYGAKYKTIEEYIEGTGAAAEYAEQTFAEYQKRQQAVLDNAANAYKTAGMSANEYMNTVNGFAASLTSSLGEYEWQAANYADMIVSDMADNANKMGTNMEMIQNAYAGFAKQNYTMLDNLKLGYGGTKTEMERLLRDAERMAGYIEGSLDIESFADIADAIHIVQEEMGITGTTAKEAASTISGSVSSMKSAWSNLVTGIADENADFELLMNNFVESTVNAAKKIVPRVGTALKGIGKLVKELVPVAMKYIPKIIGDFLPEVGEAAVGIVTSIGDSIIDNLDQILDWGQDMLDTLIDGIMKTSDSDISATVAKIITSFGNFVISNLPQVLSAGIKILLAIVNGIISSIPELAAVATQAIVNFASYLISGENLSNIARTAGNLIDSLSEGIEGAVGVLVEVGTEVVQSIINGISSAWGGLVSWFNGLWNSLFGNRSVDVNVNKTTTVSHGGRGGSFSVIDGSHALGLDYVPFDGYIAELHKGERVLTAKEASKHSSGNSFGDIIINIDGAKYNDEQSLASAIAQEIQNMTDRRAAVYA